MAKSIHGPDISMALINPRQVQFPHSLRQQSNTLGRSFPMGAKQFSVLGNDDWTKRLASHELTTYGSSLGNHDNDGNQCYW